MAEFIRFSTQLPVKKASLVLSMPVSRSVDEHFTWEVVELSVLLSSNPRVFAELKEKFCVTQSIE